MSDAMAPPEVERQPRRDGILVLGTHRSGTSALTRVLSLLGAALPAHLLSANRGNVSGHWEPRMLIRLHDGMLAEAGSRWDDWREFDPASLGPDRLAHFHSEIRRLITEEYGDTPLFVLKDPRICRMVPLYEAILGDLGIRPRFLHALRNPLAVIASLAARDQMSDGSAGLLWLRHELDAEKATRGKPRAYVTYEGLLDDWRQTVEWIEVSLGITWPRSTEEVASEIEAHLSRGLRHHTPTVAELEADERVAGWIKRTYKALLEVGRGGRKEGPALAELDSVRAEFEAVAPIFGRAMFPERAPGEAETSGTVGSSSTELDERDALIEGLRKERQALEAERDHAIAELKETTAKIEELTAQRTTLERDVEHLREDIAAARERFVASDAVVAELRSQISAIHQSRSWRLLAPAWATAAALRRFRLYLGCTMVAQPRQGLKAVGGRRSVVQWEMTDDDSWFDLAWPGPRPLPPGRYRLDLEIPDGGETLTSPRLYVDTGAGFNEAEGFALDLEHVGRVARTTYVMLPRGAFALRFDPSAAPGDLLLGRIRLRKIGRFERYGMTAITLAVQLVRDPKSGFRAFSRAVRALSRGGLREVARELRAREREAPSDYRTWLQQHDTLTAARLAELRCRLDKLDDPPLISIVMPVYDTPEVLLREAIESVTDQIFPNWELCIADDCSTMESVRDVLEEYKGRDARIRIAYRDTNGHISRASNTAFALATGDWIALLDHDDLLHPAALAEVALDIDSHPDAEIIYTDEDKLDADGVRYAPYFKPDFSRELLRSQNYLSHLTVHRAENIRAVGGWRPGFEGSQDYDLILRIIEHVDSRSIRHIPKVLYHWRAITGSTALATDMKDYAHEAGLRALEDHVARIGLMAHVETAAGTAFYRLRLALPEPRPRVDLIVPTRNNHVLLDDCVSSILAHTSYEGYQVHIVDNGSTDPDTLQYLERIANEPRVRILRYPAPFNYAAINNFAVRHTNAPIVGLINDDVEVIAGDWLSEMVSWVVQPDIGCVGAKLYYPNDTIQHAGVILGLGGVAGHAHWGIRRDDPGYFGRAALVQNFSAVTAACLVVRREVYEKVGGLNEKDLPVAFNDIDFCIRVREAGYQNVWTPYAELYHHESASRGSDESPENADRFREEILYMKTRWPAELMNDPFYSPHLTRQRHDFSLTR